MKRLNFKRLPAYDNEGAGTPWRWRRNNWRSFSREGAAQIIAIAAMLVVAAPDAIAMDRRGSLTTNFMTRAAPMAAPRPSVAIPLPRPLYFPPRASAALVTVPSTQSSGAAITVEQRARALERQTRATNHEIATGPGRWRRYDLSGRGHRDFNGVKVPTPHFTDERRNVNINPLTGDPHDNKPIQSEVQRMTHRDLRALERALRERRGPSAEPGGATE